MTQQINGQFVRPIYNGVNIRIRKPEVNTGTQTNTFVNDNGIYNAVNIDVDNPVINPVKPRPIYNYPENKELISYNTFAPHRCYPSDMFLTYNKTTNILMPKIEAEVENKIDNIGDTKENSETKSNKIQFSTLLTPNYVELNKIKADETQADEVKNEPIIQRPEIIPAEEIKPEIDIQQVIHNLNSNDFDIQALQMEEIVKTAFQDRKKAEIYITRDVFENLIDILNKDTTTMEAPNAEQLEIRDKYMYNSMINDEGNSPETSPKQAFYLSEKEILEAKELTPLELAERNKEYAITALTVLSKMYIDGVEKTSGNIIPLTEIPGMSDIIEALRVSPNSDIKIDAINSLKYLQRPEYKDELSALYSLAANDTNKDVAMTAQQALEKLEEQTN